MRGLSRHRLKLLMRCLAPMHIGKVRRPDSQSGRRDALLHDFSKLNLIMRVNDEPVQSSEVDHRLWPTVHHRDPKTGPAAGGRDDGNRQTNTPILVGCIQNRPL